MSNCTSSGTEASSLGLTLGVFQNANSVASFLLGITTLQLYYYFEHHPGDGPYLKGLVVGLWIMELAHLISTLHFTYWETFEVGPASLATISGNIASVNIFVIVCALIDLTVKSFYGLWLRQLSKRWEIPVVCWTLALAQLGIAIGMTRFLDTSRLLAMLQDPGFRQLVIGFGACRFAVEVILSTALCYYVIRAEGTGSRLGRGRLLLLLTETGVFTALIQLTALATTIWSTSNFIYLGLTLIRDKASTSSFLVALNSRHLWKATMPLVDLGKKPFFPTLPHTQKDAEMKVLDIHVEKRHLDSVSSKSSRSEQVFVTDDESPKCPFNV